MRSDRAKFTHAEIAAYYAVRVPNVKQNASGQWRGPCPIHRGTRHSFAVSPGTGQWYCHSQCDRGGSIIKLEMAITRAAFKTAKAKVYQVIGRKNERAGHGEWRTVAKYVYTDELGKPLSRVIRRQRGEGAE